MTEITRQQQAGITKRNNGYNALMDVADGVFTDSDYRSIGVDRIFSHAAISSATFYTYFSGKSAWGAAVLDRRLNEALDQQAVPETGIVGSSYARLLGHFGLLEKTAAQLPGITEALVAERLKQRQYGDLLPRYYDTTVQILAGGQERGVFRSDAVPTGVADFALDSLASAYALHLDNPTARAMSSRLILGACG